MNIKDFEFKDAYKKYLITKMNDCKKKGATNKEIAEKLNAEDIKTVMGLKWSPQSVFRFYRDGSKKK